MIPKKANKLYKEVAEDLDTSELLVEVFIEAYYKEARQCLIELKYPRINMDGLGHFVAKKGLVNLNIPRIQNETTQTHTNNGPARLGQNLFC